MKNVVFVALLLAILAGAAMAQDSVSKAQGVANSDAVSPYDTTEQVNNFVVDLAPFTTSWGTKFGIAPIVKSSLVDPGNFYSGLLGGQSISRTLGTKQNFVRNSYSLWRGQGFGINGNATVNDPGTSINTTGFVGNQFAALFSEFGGNAEDTIGAIVNYLPGRPSRLYVSRVVAATNGLSAAEDTASMATGGIDYQGFATFRADAFGTSGPNPLTGDNYFRIDLAGRNASINNKLDGSGAADAAATDQVLVNSGTTHASCTMFPSGPGGGNRPVTIGSNFNGEYVYESSAGNLSTTTAHRGGSSDIRGCVSWHDVAVFNGTGFNNSIGTATQYGKDGGSLTRRILMWGTDANGAVTGTASIDPPSTITDNDDSFTFPSLGTIDEFVHHVSQTSFRGGNGQVAIGRDQAGRILVSTPVVSSILAPAGNNPVNAMAVARFDASDIDGTLEWTTATWNDFPNGKAILDGPDGNVIGQIVELGQVTGNDPLGPSISAPCFDSVGNLWCVAAVELFDRLPGGESDFDTALVRCVYNPDEFSYQVELVVEVGSVFRGQNSDTNYQVRFFGIADSNSVSSSTMFSGNILRGAVNGINPKKLETSDPRTLGGLVFQAEIVYDVNGDGSFDKVTGSGGDPASLDQEYNVLLYVGALSARGTGGVTF